MSLYLQTKTYPKEPTVPDHTAYDRLNRGFYARADFLLQTNLQFLLFYIKQKSIQTGLQAPLTSAAYTGRFTQTSSLFFFNIFELKSFQMNLFLEPHPLRQRKLSNLYGL